MPKPFRLFIACALLILGGCANFAIDQSERQALAGDYEEAYATLDAVLKDHPRDAQLRTAHARARDRVVVRALTQAEVALASGRTDEARRLLDRVRALDPANARLLATEAGAERNARERLQAQARRVGGDKPPATAPRVLGPAFQKPLALEFREAPLRQVFESLARSSAINFVFDKDVRTDARVTVFLRDVTLDEAMRVILTTQQLDRKVLNDNTVLIYPNSPNKQREHQELVTRSLYLTNADAKVAVALVRAMAKTRDVHVDERLNALVVRDTPEVIAFVEKLLATIDLPDPEVTLAVEIREVATSLLQDLGIDWPSQVQFGLLGGAAQVPLNTVNTFRGSIANPALVAAIRASSSNTNLLANPTIRARNREKAKVQVGEKLPVFSTTTASLQTGASTSVTTLDVGLKLDLEPTVLLDNDVAIKVGLEVSSLIKQITGPNGSTGYEIGTRITTTSLRLRDGETQVLAGLINDDDRHTADGLPGLLHLPLIGRLFSTKEDRRDKTEIVMLITPHIVRNLPLPDVADATLYSGTDALPGAEPLRLRPSARAAVGVSSGAVRGSPSLQAAVAEAAAGAADAPQATAPSGPTLVLSATEEAGVGDTVSVTLANRSGLTVKGEIEVDATLLRLASGVGQTGSRVAFNAGPRQDAVLVFRVLPAAAGAEIRPLVVAAQGTASDGATMALSIEGGALIRVRAKAAGSK